MILHPLVVTTHHRVARAPAHPLQKIKTLEKDSQINASNLMCQLSLKMLPKP